jgi:hypothetical protein
MTWKLIWTFSDSCTESKSEKDEQWLWSWYGHSVTCGLRVKLYSHSTSHWMSISTSRSLFVSLRFTLSPQVTECPYQLPGHCSSLSVLLSVHNSLNAHINFPVIVRLSPFYSQSTSHWMPISTSRSLFVSHRFTLSPQVTECREQWLGSWYGHSVTRGLRVKRRETNNDLEVDMGIQWLVDWE